MAMGYLISGHLNVPTSMMKNMYYESVMVFNATFNNISVIGITSPSSYQCRKTKLVHFVIHGRHTSMECMCAYWGFPKINFQNK